MKILIMLHSDGYYLFSILSDKYYIKMRQVAVLKTSLLSAGITNAEFRCGKAEDVLPSVMHCLNNTDVVAVVDPPRSGLR